MVETSAATLKLPYVAVELAGSQERLAGAATGQIVAETVEMPLRYQSETVGYLVVSPRSPAESFTPRERQLSLNMAGQTGAMAYAVRLTVALQRSRERLVLAREEERRRIRRDLHAGLPPEHRPGVGLNSMRERSEELGGRFEIVTPAEGGTRVIAHLPLARALI